MTDTPTPVYGFRQQELGTNTNTWGDDKLNNVLVGMAQTMGKILGIAITGDYTITSTNYVPTADNRNHGFKFTGTLTANATITIPSSAATYYIINATTGGFSLLVKTAAGATVTVPASRQVVLYCDGTDAINLVPNLGGLATPTTATLDIPGWSAVENAIATAGLPATAGTVLVSGTDTTAGYIGTKFQAFGTHVASVGTSGGDETLDSKPTVYTAAGTDIYTATPSPAYTAYSSGMAFYVLFTNANTGAATLNVNSLGAKAITKNGSDAIVFGDIPALSVKLVVYDGTQFQLLPAASPTLGLTNGGAKTSGFTAAVNTRYNCLFAASGTITLPASATADDVIVLALADSSITYTVDPNSLNMNGATTAIVFPSNNTITLTYSGAAQGWV